MLRSARQLQLEDKAFHQCAQDKKSIRNWIESAQLKANDGQVTESSLDTRVEAVYDSIFNISLAVLNAERWRPISREGHHIFTLEAACAAIGASEGLFDRLDALREVRNLKYSGIRRSERDLAAAQKLLDEYSALAIAWFQGKYPQLLRD